MLKQKKKHEYYSDTVYLGNCPEHKFKSIAGANSSINTDVVSSNTAHNYNNPMYNPATNLPMQNSSFDVNGNPFGSKIK